jgi:hypothetical protein
MREFNGENFLKPSKNKLTDSHIRARYTTPAIEQAERDPLTAPTSIS